MIGAQIGVYQILELMGAGGMGEVYRAHDTRLGRDVALKVLPGVVANDPDRLMRLEREARLLASLSHPHIATLHSLEEADGVRALVMELVTGPTLADTLAHAHSTRGLPVQEALNIAAQITQALEAAHEKGIVHRDLKPANIKVTSGGTVKVLDFGIAKTAMSGEGDHVSSATTFMATNLPAGTIVGTPAYMSPEQARGKAVDKRTDIWAFGCVLYEMLTGRSAFERGTVTETLAAILEREPDWDALPSQVADGIRSLLRRCLEKDHTRRLRDIGEARIQIENARSDHPAPKPPAGQLRRPSTTILALVATSLAALAAGAAVWALTRPPAQLETRFEITTPPAPYSDLAVSPDGRKIAFVAISGGQPHLWVRELASVDARPLPGTERAASPFWSPDSRSIGFFSDHITLKRIDVDGGSLRALATLPPRPLGGTWNRDGVILFGAIAQGPLRRIAADGGEVSQVTDPPSATTHSFPVFLPDGRHFLFFAGGTPAARGVHVGQLDDPNVTRLLTSDGPAQYTASGHLLFPRQGKLWAQRFDAQQLQLRGDAFEIASAGQPTALSASAAGPIVYRSIPPLGQQRLIWVDRTGKETRSVAYGGGGAESSLALSHDGRRVAIFQAAAGNMDIWALDVGRGTWDRVTVDDGPDWAPLWSRDDASLLFNSVGGGPLVGFRRKVLAGGPDSEPVFQPTKWVVPMDWSPDGEFVLFDALDPKTSLDIWALPLGGDRKPFPVVQSEFIERQAQFSPDGRWIAYHSDKTGRFEVYLKPFARPGGDVRVSTTGGMQARWNPNGRELFYQTLDRQVIAVPLRSAPDGAFEPGTAVKLFARNPNMFTPDPLRQDYAVGRDGQSFVLHSYQNEYIASPITVILNWQPKE